MKKSKQSKNKTKKNEAEEMIKISSLINQDKFKEALGRIKSFEKQNPSSKTLRFNKLCFLVDIGSGLRDPRIVQEGLGIGEQSLTTFKNTEYESQIHYNLANGYQSLYTLSERGIGIEAIPQSENLQKAKLHFRAAIKLCDDLNLDFKKQIWVNYGNCLDCLGRGVEALYAYDETLKVDQHFSMAILNKAMALCFFADISGKYRGAIYLEAYQAIKSIINNQDLIAIGGLAAKKAAEGELQKIKMLFKKKKDLIKKPKHPKYNRSRLSAFEKFFIDFCLKEKLFLNLHVHQEHCEAAITDPIFIRIITKLRDDMKIFYNFAKYINQIKEDYAVARLFLVQSQYKQKDFNNISTRTTFVNSLDYSEFNLYIGLLKSAFKEAYNILDKIAVFINDYYALGFKEEDIYFTSIRNTKPKESIWEKTDVIRAKILQSKNICLYALYDIYQDFKSGTNKKIQIIRNALTHRKLVIFDSVLTDWDTKNDKHNIGYDTMLNETIHLLQLTKSAIIYLTNFVNTEENKKMKNGLMGSMFVDTSQFL